MSIEYNGILTPVYERTARDGQRFTLDWGMIPAAADKPIHLQSGDIVKIFKTIKEGSLRWDGVVDLEFERNIVTGPTGYSQQAYENCWVHGFQRDLVPEQWGEMFFASLPAKLTKNNGVVIFGALEAFCETGTEGVIWSVSDYNETGYEALHCLENGDHLEIYGSVQDGEIIFEGALEFEDNPYELDAARELMLRRPTHVEAQEWLSMSYGNMPLTLERT